MIGTGLKKLAKQHNMKIAKGVAYGSLKGYATTLSEGAGYKRIDIATRFAEFSGNESFQEALNSVDTARLYRVQKVWMTSRTISVTFHDTVGTMKKIEAFIDWFYPILEQNGALKSDICLECGAQITSGSWYMLNGVAYHMHDSCSQKISSNLAEQEQQRREEDTGSYVGGFLGALIGALLGSVVWALVLYMGYVASLVGLLIGWLAEKGYTLLKGKQGKGKIAILIVVIILGVLLGTVLPDVVILAGWINEGMLPGYGYGDIPSLIVEILAADAEYMTSMLSNAGMGLLFAALGVFALLRRTQQEVTGVSIKKLDA